MRWREALIPTLRDVPKEAEAVSHRLMLKAGYIRKLSAGVYSYLPLGFRVLQNVSRIIREEMGRAGSVELLLPSLHPAELWKKTGRFDALGEDKIAFLNRSGQEFVLGPTHEEVITELISAYVQSYQDLPLSLYQIQTKFRDELRPRFGIVRTKEFIMKDAYSFHRDEKDLEKTYQAMYEAYQRIMDRCGLTIQIVSADSGVMGGSVSHEFMAVSPYGEDHIAVCKRCKTSVSQDLAERKIDQHTGAFSGGKGDTLQSFDTPNLKTISELVEHFGIQPERMIKTILYAADKKIVAACVDGASEINESKLKKAIKAKSLELATPEEIERATGAPLGFSGPVGLKDIFIVADADVLKVLDAVTGANQKDKHFRNVNHGKDWKADLVSDIRQMRAGDVCPRCSEPYELVTSMELGHTFQLGTRYSKALDANYRDERGEMHPIIMGCYGIGVNRILAAAIEEHHDEKGIIWPASIAPFQVLIMTLNEQDEPSRKTAQDVYDEFISHSYQILYDDRDARAGVKFNDADLIGIPIQVIVSERNLAKNQLEIKTRRDRKSLFVERGKVLGTVESLLKEL